MNLSWGGGAIAASATDFVGVIWNGRILSEHSEAFEFEIGTGEGGDAARLWVDGVVVIDGFERRGTGVELETGGADKDGLGGGGRGSVNLTAGVLHDIRVEYRCAG